MKTLFTISNKPSISFLISAFLVLISSTTVFSGIVEKTYHFEKPLIYEKDNYDFLEMNECSYLEIPTKPKLPTKRIKLLLPPGEKAVNITINRQNLIPIEGRYFVYPAQYPRINSDENYFFTQPDMEFYASNDIYPKELHSSFNTQYYRGHSIVVVEIYPVVYQPGAKRLSYYSQMTVTVETSPETESENAFNNLYRDDDKTRNNLKYMVQNQSAMAKYPVLPPSKSKYDYDVDYLIITSADYVDDFSEFVKFKKLQGYNTAIVTVEGIYDAYSGYDEQDKIRMCIKGYYQVYGTDYVLLGGDAEIVPHRGLFGHFVFDPPEHETDYDIPADMYYAALDRVGYGTGPDWNVDNDDMWGEYDVGDPEYGDITEADFSEEVFIGRISADSHQEFANALNKLIKYQKEPVVSDNKKSIMVGQKMWAGYCGDEAKEEVRLGGTYDGYTTAGFEDGGFVSQLQYACQYLPDSAWPLQDLVDKMNAGTNIINHLGHGWLNGYMKFYSEDGSVDLLTSNGENHNFYFIYSQNCYGSSFDNRHANLTYGPDCMTEAFVTHPNGAFAAVGNSRYGISGVSQKFDRYFFDAMFKSTSPIKKLGEMNSYSKEQSGYNSEAKRWEYFELNLFGDPSLELWTTDNPSTITSAVITSSVYIGMTQVSVQVNPAVAGLKVSVCTDNSDMIFGTALTNSSGIATVYLNHEYNQNATIFGMVTAPDYLPYSFIGGTEIEIWTGNVSSEWHNSANWESGFVPDLSTNVTIPNGCPHYPFINSDDAYCYDLIIESGASMIIGAKSLTIDNNLTVYGELKMNSDLSDLTVEHNVNWESGSTSIITQDDAMITVKGQWTFKNNSNVNLDKGTVKFTGNLSKSIICYSSGSYFNNVIIAKDAGKKVYFSASCTEDMVIKGDLTINTGAVFMQYADKNIILDGIFDCNGNFKSSNGTFVFNGASLNFYFNSDSYFNNLEINVTGGIMLMDDVTINGDFVINNGSVIPNSNDITIAGNWENNVGISGFAGSSGTVIFNGDNDQNILTDESFNVLELNKPAGSLKINNNVDVICNVYNWTQGALLVNSGSFTANDLDDIGIFGDYTVENSGNITLKNYDSFVDLNGNISISTGGTFDVYGDADDSYWPYWEDASLTMTGGTLDFHDVGIYVGSMLNHSFTENITGGTIKTYGGFICDRSDFNPTGGTIELYGPEDVQLSHNAGSVFFNVSIDKSAKNKGMAKGINKPDYSKPDGKTKERKKWITRNLNGTKGNSVLVAKDLNINNNMIIDNGELILNGKKADIDNFLFIQGTLTMTNPDDELWVGEEIWWEQGATGNITDGLIAFEGDWRFSDGINVQISPGNNTAAIGVANQTIVCSDNDACFGNLTISQQVPGKKIKVIGSEPVRVAGDLTINPENTLNLNNEDLSVNGQSNVFNNAFLELENNSTFTTDNDMDLFGTVHLTNSNITVHNDLNSNSSCSLIIDGGSFVVDKASTGQIQTILGYCEINGGILEFTNNGIQFGSSANVVMTGGELSSGWQFKAIYPNTFQPTGGTVRMKGSGFSSIIMDNTNYFNNLIINKPSTETMNISQPTVVNNDFTVQSGRFNTDGLDFTINGNLIIESAGILDPDNGTVYLGGDWTNNGGGTGFVQGNSLISFISSGESFITTNEDFYNLEVNKTGNDFTYVNVNQNLTINILNNLTITNRSLGVHNNATLNIDGDIVISDDGCLLAASGEPVNINIGGNWYNHNTSGHPITYGFFTGLSSVSFNGSDDQNVDADYGMQEFYNLIIDKPSNSFYPLTNIVVNNDVEINNGEWGNDDPGHSYNFYGNITIESGGVFDDNSCIVNISGSGNRNLVNNSTTTPVFGELHLNMNIIPPKDMPVFELFSDIQCYSDIQIDTGNFSLNANTVESFGNFAINENGKVSANDQSTIAMGDGSTLGISGGELEMIGDETNHPILTHISGYYEFTVSNQGLLSANNATFEYMDASGINIYSTGEVYGTHALSNCTFQNGQSGGTLLQINNDQDLIISGVSFPDNTWSGTHNVAKTVNQGTLTFTNYSGNFSGPAYENDPYNKIDWGNNVAGIWTGVFDSHWNNTLNWQNNQKPASTDDVFIPAGTPNDPVVAISDQDCNNITLANGASLHIYDETLTVHGDMLIYGELIMDNASGVLNAGDSYSDIISWEHGSTDDVTAGTINITGNWYFKTGSNVQLGTNNTVVFYGTNGSNIYCNVLNDKFGKLHINKTATSGYDYVKVPANNFLTVASECYILDGSLMLFDNVIMKVYDEIFVSNGGTLSAIGSIGNEVTVSGYTNHALFEIGSGGTISAEHTTFEFLDEMYIGSSAIVDPLHPFNNCTFREGTTNGTLISINNNQSLTIDSVTFPYNTWGGNYNVSKTTDQGHITFTNVQGGFVGENYENDTYDRIDWPGVTAGIWEGTVSTVWDDSANWKYYLKPSISDDVTITSSAPYQPVIFNADQECNSVNIQPGASLTIKGKTLTLHDDIIIFGTLNMTYPGSVLNAGDAPQDMVAWRNGSTANVSNGTINVFGKWYFYDGINASFGAGNTTSFYGDNFSDIYCYDDDASFGNLTINKTSATHNVVTVNANQTVRVAEDFYITDGVFKLNDGSVLQVGNELYVDDGGTLTSIGTSVNNATITGTTNYCNLEIANGGTIGAEYTIFQFLESTGLTVNPGATIDSLHPLNYCTFQESPAGGTLLSVNNDQVVTVDGAVFPENTWSGAYNVSRTLDQGNITFTNVDGAFVGERYEDDSYGRIDWPGVIAGIWTGLISPIWNDAGNWQYNLKPYAGDDVYIPAGTPNDCWVSSADHECNNITIEPGAMLRIYDETLTVHGDMLIYGYLKMDNSAGVLNAGDSYDDMISWESGSYDIISNGTINVYGQWYFQNGTNAQLGAGNTVNFYGSNNSTIYCYDSDAEFGNITINKTVSPHNQVNIVAYSTVKVAEDLYVTEGKFCIDQGSTLQVGNELYIDDGCTLETYGIGGKEARISGYPGYCSLEVANSGLISAEYTIFEYLNGQGLVLNPGAIVDTNHAFTSCTFREGTVGGSLLTINNDQDFTVDGAIFPANTWSGTYNAVKTLDQGHVIFTNVTGDFAGENNENDTYDRIDWFTPWYDLNVRVFLEGPFETSTMQTKLSPVIPLSQPYNTTPWNYNGTESVPEIPNYAVDWILVELHDATDVEAINSGNLISQRAVFLKNNGYITNIDGESFLKLNTFINNNLFIVVRHRNHIGVVSAFPVPLTQGIYTYNFTISADRAYGDADAHKEIAPGIWGMAGGNGNPDNIINNDDYLLWKSEAGKTGYKMEDFNLDKQVDNKDKNEIWLNSIGIECWIPE